MDPELYVFPRINSGTLKIAASTGLFAVALALTGLIISLLPGLRGWETIERNLVVGSLSIHLPDLVHIVVGYGLFIYASYHAWKATRLKNTVEDPRHELATRVLDSGYYARVRHPMYAMFILANAGLGFAMNSIYGLGFSLLSLVLFVANGIFEEKVVMLRFFSEDYQAYMSRVKARYFTPAQAIVLIVILGVYLAALLYR